MSETDTDEFFDAEIDNDVNKSLVYKFRSHLPQPMPSKANFSVWQFLKQCIGKELSKITMPIVFNEPISFLQRLSEYMEYSYLLNEAIDQTDPVYRMEKVCAFAVSVMASNWDRIGKPFNPLLGETYELQTDNFKWLSEQVSHHPPISAFYCELPGKFKFYGSVHPKLKFWGKSVEITPKGNVTLELLPWNEAYTWQNVTCTVHNVIIGKIWIEHSGIMKITKHNLTSSNKSVNGTVTAELQCHSVGWFGRNMHRVTGEICCKNPNSHKSNNSNNTDNIIGNNINNNGSGCNSFIKKKLYGKWTEALFSVDNDVWSNNAFGDMGNSTSNTRTGDNGALGVRSGSYRDSKHTDRPDNNPIPSPASSASLNNEDNTDEDDDSMPSLQNAAPCDLGLSNQRLIWCATSRPATSNEFYNFTSYTMGLNQLSPLLTQYLAPTDSRFRRDMRLMEEGMIDEASVAKTELEEKQRAKRNGKSKQNSPNKKNQSESHSNTSSPKKSKPKKIEGPIWFAESENSITKKTEWMFKGTYWDRDWSLSPDIF